MGHSTDRHQFKKVRNTLLHPPHRRFSQSLLSLVSSDGYHLPTWRGLHGDRIPFWADCLHGIRVDHVLQEQGVLLGGGGGWGLAKDNNLSAGSLQQDVSQLFLCGVDHWYTIHLHQSTRSITHTHRNTCQRDDIETVTVEYSSIRSSIFSCQLIKLEKQFRCFFDNIKNIKNVANFKLINEGEILSELLQNIKCLSGRSLSTGKGRISVMPI